MSSKRKSTSKSPKHSQKERILKDDEIDRIMEDITLKKPRSGYTHFCIDEVEKFKKKNKAKKIDLKTFSKECAAKWKELSDKEKEKYDEKFEEDKIKYKKDIETVKHYLFMDYNDVVRRPPTAYRIFLNERLRDGFDKNKDPKEVKKKASDDWRKMSIEDKSEYLKKKEDNDDWFERAKKTRKVTPLTMFVQKAVKTAKDQGKDVPRLPDLAATWKSLKKADKEKYVRYADEINEDRDTLQNLYELVNGIKPKRPAGAFRVFLQEKAKEKVLHSLSQGKEMWNKLSEDEKEAYLKKAHTYKLAYKYKKMIYNKKVRKILPKKPLTAYSFFLKEKKGIKMPKGEKAVVYWREEFNNLSKDKRKKYEEKAEKDKERYEKKMLEFKNVVFDMPKRPLTAFSLFVRDRLPDLKKEDKETPTPELLRKVAKEWQKEEGVSQAKYEKKAEYDKKRFKKQLRDFETLGYYKKNYRAEKSQTKSKRSKDEDESEVEESEEEERKTKKKRRSTSTSRKSSKKTRSKSKSKTQDVKRSSKSRKKSRTQRKNK